MDTTIIIIIVVIVLCLSSVVVGGVLIASRKTTTNMPATTATDISTTTAMPKAMPKSLGLLDGNYYSDDPFLPLEIRGKIIMFVNAGKLYTFGKDGITSHEIPLRTYDSLNDRWLNSAPSSNEDDLIYVKVIDPTHFIWKNEMLVHLYLK